MIQNFFSLYFITGYFKITGVRCTEQTFGLWEKVREGCFERTACILSIVKQITSLGGMHETSARTWCTGKTQRNRGWGIHVTPWLIHVNVWQNPLKCCEVISLQLIKINEKNFLKKVTGIISWLHSTQLLLIYSVHSSLYLWLPYP